MKPIKTIRKTTTLSRSARVLTYLFNALIDAEISYELIRLLPGSNLKDSAQLKEAAERAKFYSQLKAVQVEGQLEPTMIAGLAYNLYYANGLANWLYAQLFRPLLTEQRRFLVDKYFLQLKSQLTTPFVFQEFIRKHYAASYWPTVVTKRKTWVDQFMSNWELDPLEIKLTDKVLKETALIVQKHNSQFNQRVARWLLEENGPHYQKLNLLRAAAKESTKEKRFIKTCARVQLAAARWDGLYSHLVRE
jgi:hypothetical protein